MGALMVSSEGSCAAYFQLPTSEGDGEQPGVAGMKSAVVPDSVTPKIRFREPQSEMAHGAGGIASRRTRLVEGPLRTASLSLSQPQPE